MALTTTPLESQFYVLDFGGGAFSPLADLPHVAGVATRSEPDVVRRIVAEVTGIVDRREAYFRAHGIDSIETYRRSRRGQAGPTTATATCSSSSTAGARCAPTSTTSSCRSSSWPPRGLTFGVHLVVGQRPLGRLPGRDPRPVRHPARAAARRPDRLRDRPQGRRAGARGPTRPRSGAGQAALPRRTAAHRRRPRRRDPRRRRRGPDQAGQRGLERAGTGPKLRLLPDRIGLDALRAQAGPDRPSGSLLGIDEKDLARSASTPTPSRTCSSSATASPARARCCAPTLREVMRTRTPRRPRSSSSTTGARCSARCPTTTCSTT